MVGWSLEKHIRTSLNSGRLNSLLRHLHYQGVHGWGTLRPQPYYSLLFVLITQPAVRPSPHSSFSPPPPRPFYPPPNTMTSKTWFLSSDLTFLPDGGQAHYRKKKTAASLPRRAGPSGWTSSPSSSNSLTPTLRPTCRGTRTSPSALWTTKYGRTTGPSPQTP